MRWLAAAFATFMIFAVLVLLGRTDPARSQPITAESIATVLQDLGPDTTLHTVVLSYRRHGTDGTVPMTEGPEWRRNETFMSFDQEGLLASYQAESHDLGGSPIATSSLEGSDLVFRDSGGSETGRLAGFRSRHTVGDMKQRLSQGQAGIEALLESRLDVRQVSLDSQELLVLEDRVATPRSPSPRGDGSGYQIPSVDDLGPVAIFSRLYFLPTVNFFVKKELVAIGSSGEEIVLESGEFEVYEILQDSQ